MDDKELSKWFEKQKREIFDTYLLREEPWEQSGKSGPEERWTACRKSVADCIEKSGSFLDIGCANGYLLECTVRWVKERDIEIVPYGLDLSEELIQLAKDRLPEYSDNLYTGNAWYWDPPERYDYVRTELVYVPDNLQKQYIERILDKYLSEKGELLIALYGSIPVNSRRDGVEKIEKWGYKISRHVSGYWEDKECSRILVIGK